VFALAAQQAASVPCMLSTGVPEGVWYALRLSRRPPPCAHPSAAGPLQHAARGSNKALRRPRSPSSQASKRAAHLSTLARVLLVVPCFGKRRVRAPPPRPCACGRAGKGKEGRVLSALDCSKLLACSDGARRAARAAGAGA
jgi:hypothetical protein